MKELLLITCLLSTPSETFERKLKRRAAENREQFNNEYKEQIQDLQNMEKEELDQIAHDIVKVAQRENYALSKAIIYNKIKDYSAKKEGELKAEVQRTIGHWQEEVEASKGSTDIGVWAAMRAKGQCIDEIKQSL